MNIDAYPMPRIEELIDNLGRAKFISTLDLSQCYWQVPVESESQAKTAFTTQFGLYRFWRMPFGLQGVPATFQRMVDKLLDGLQYCTCANAYLDDLVIHSETWEDHLHHLSLVCDQTWEAGLTAKPNKCLMRMN